MKKPYQVQGYVAFNALTHMASELIRTGKHDGAAMALRLREILYAVKEAEEQLSPTAGPGSFGADIEPR